MRRDSVVPCLLVLLPLLCVGPMGCARAMHGEEAVEEEEYPVEPPPFVLEQLKERDLPCDHNVNAPLRPRGLRDTERTPLPVEDLQEEEGVVAAPRVVHTCIHDALMEQYKDTIQTVEQEDGKKKRDPLPRSLEEALSLDPSRVRKIRIKPVFDLLYEDVDACFSTRSGDGYASGGRRYACTQKSQVLTSTKRNFIITVVNEAIDWLERALYLEPMSSLRLSSFSSTAKCLEMTIPGSIFTATHTDADYLLFVTGRPTSGSVLAWAGGCFRDASTGRPIAGQANFGPNAVDVDGEAPDKYVGTAIHELMHALGFSSGWFPEDVFRHTSGISAKALGKTIYRIRSPRVKEEVRSHFGCSASEWSFAGAELEDGGGSGSVGSHFEKRIFMDEIMTATIALNPIISRITLATFEDTGWYLVDYNQAEVNPWGRHTGTSCFFARNSCLSWPDEYFCASKTSRLCTTDTTSRGYCNLASFSTSLPSNVRYFTKSTLGGSDSYADYCPYQAVLKDCRINRGPFSPSLEIWAEKFGSRSRCFVSTLIKSGWSVPGASTHGGCHKTLCSSSGRLLILLEPTGYYWYCPRYGGRICDFEGYGGCITCPPSADVCTGCADNDNCNDRGTCVNGECVCGPGWGGKDCSKALYDSTIFRDVESVVFTPLRAQTVTSFTIPDGEFRDYDILVPSAGVNISIIAEIDTGDVDMYVNPPTSIETLPDRTHNIWRSDSVGNITEEVAIYGETDWYFATGIYKIALYSDAPGGSTGRITVSIDCPFINGTTERHECLDVLAFCPNGCSLHGLCQDFGDNETEDFRCSCFPSWNCTKMDDTDEVKRTERCDCENRQPASAVLDAGDVNKERTVVVAIGVSVVTLAILLAVGIAIYHSTVVAARKAEEKALEMERRADRPARLRSDEENTHRTFSPSYSPPLSMASADIPLVNPTSESPYIHHNAFSTWRRPVAVMAVGVVFTFLLCVIVLVLTAKTMADVQDLKSDGGDGDGSPDTSPDYRRAVEALKTNMDETVRPCDDFYRFACGGWLERTQIPSDAARYGRFAEIQEGNEKVLNTILEEDWPLLTSFYRSCLDEGRINAHGKTPALPLFTNAGVELYDGTGEGAMKAAAALTRSGIPVFFSLWVDDDLRNALKYGQYIGQGGLSLPDRDYYLDDALASTRDSFVAHMTQMFQYMGIDATQGEEKARGVLAFETEIARISFPKDQLRDPPGTYHKISIADLQTSTDNFPWGTFFQEIGAPDGMDVILQLPINEDKDIQFMQQLGSLITTSSAEDVTAYLQWKVVHGLNGYLSSDFVTETFTFFGKVIDGQSEPVPRWKKCLRDTDAALGGALGHHFVSRVFSEASQEDAGDMIHRIEEAFGLESLAKLEWMDDTTRGRAVTKLGMVTNKVGYPGRFLNYDMLELGQEFFENQKAANDLYWSREMAKIGTDVDPDLWYMTVPTVNAYYTPTGNQMVFPAGILRPPFYNHTYPVQLNYGGIGMVMGHELTHGFDDQGRQFDGSGNLNSWWEEATAAKFEDLAACLVDQYSAFEVQPGVFVNGRLTLGENIADNGGIRNAYFAYKALEQEKGPFARVMEEYTNDQLFFIAFAQTWCTKAKPEMERKLVKVDVHSPPRFRILGPLGNFDEFGKTFSCPKGSTMNPHAKCRIW